MVHHQGRLEHWLPTWRPWPGETLSLTFSRPTGTPGPTLTRDESSYSVRPGQGVAAAVLELALRSSQGGRHVLRLPLGAELQRVVVVDVRERPLRLRGQALHLQLAPGTQRMRIEWWQPGALGYYYSPPPPDLGIDGVNASTRVELGWDRWILFTGGPDLGPAVLFWSLVGVLIPLSIGLGCSRLTPLKTRDWLLLGLGLSQAGVWAGLIVVGWLLALGLRVRLVRESPPLAFQSDADGSLSFSLAALMALVLALRQGLLGLPEMQIAGNGSSHTSLSWDQDRSGPEPTPVWVISVPIWVYRGLMLVWALWLAHRLLDWLCWGWGELSRPVFWKNVSEAKIAFSLRGLKDCRDATSIPTL